MKRSEMLGKIESALYDKCEENEHFMGGDPLEVIDFILQEAEKLGAKLPLAQEKPLAKEAKSKGKK